MVSAHSNRPNRDSNYALLHVTGQSAGLPCTDWQGLKSLHVTGQSAALPCRASNPSVLQANQLPCHALIGRASNPSVLQANQLPCHALIGRASNSMISNDTVVIMSKT